MKNLMEGGEHPADSLARLIFVETPCSASIELSLPSLGCARDLFFMLLDLFIRGLLLLYGGSDAARDGIAVHEITSDQIDTLDSKLRVAGVRCRYTTGDARGAGAWTNVDELMDAEPGLPLGSYRLEAQARGRLHTMWFELEHNVRPGSRSCAGFMR